MLEVTLLFRTFAELQVRLTIASLQMRLKIAIISLVFSSLIVLGILICTSTLIVIGLLA